MKKYDERHGGPYDRGSADAYYRRPWNPHYYKGASKQSELVNMTSMTEDEIAAYSAGFGEQINSGDFKDWR